MRVRRDTCRLFTAIAAMAFVASPASAQTGQNLIVPLFIVDGPSLTTAIDQIAIASPAGATAIVLDFGIGTWAGTQPDTATLSAAVDRAHAGGVNVFGYVPTCFGNTSTAGYCGTLPHAPSNINSYVDVWFTAAPSLDGIFFDQGPNDAAYHAFYKTIRDHAAGKRVGAKVMLNNPGWYQNDTAVFELADIVGIFENACGQFPPPFSQRPASEFNPPGGPQKIYMLVEQFNSSCPTSTLADVIQTLQNEDAGNLYLYDGSTAAYDHLAANWTQQAALVYGVEVNVTMAGAGTGTVQSNPPGINCGSGTCTAWLGSGQPVTLNASADANSEFRGFSGACTSSTPTCTFTPTSGASVTATFAPHVTVPVTVALSGSGAGTVTSSPAAIACSWNGTVVSGTCSAPFFTGQQITLTAVANTGSTFAGFTSGTCTTSSPTSCTFTPSAAATYTGRFDLQSFSLSVASTTLNTPSGTSGINTITVTPTSGFSSAVSLSVSDLPSGAGAPTWSVNPVLSGSGSSVLTLSSGTAAAGTYPITVTGQGGGLTRTTSFNWTIGTPPLVISNLGASTYPTTSTITWTTDLSSDSTVDYGTTTAYGSSATGNTGTAHTVNVTGLTAGATYHYRVRSKTGAGAPEAVTGDRVMPLISSVSAGTPASTSAAITWTTNFSSNHVVDYGTTAAYGSTQTSGAAEGTAHSVTLSGLSPATTYHFRVRSAGGLDSSTSGDFTFVTSSVPGTTPVASLTDAFDTFDASKWSVSTRVTGDDAWAWKGLLTLTPAANTGAAGVTVESRNVYSLLNSSATVNALEVVAASGGINCKFRFQAPGSASSSEVLGFWYEGGTLYAYYYTGGVQVSVGSVGYSRDAHAWWRIRHSGSTVYWETSRDRATWSVLGQVQQSAITFDLGNGVLAFNVRAFGSGNAVPGHARFTHLNIAPTPIASLTDPFTSIDPAKWYVGLGTAGSAASASGGVLSLMAEPSTGAGSAKVISMRPYPLTGSSIIVKVPQTVSGQNVNQIFRVAPGPFNYDDEVGFWYEGGTLYAYQRAFGDTSTVAALPYSPSQHAWWRLRESAGTVYWDTSADGVTWTQRGWMSVGGLSFSPAMVSVYMSTNEWGSGSPSPGTAQFSNLNAP